jgi:hypothetical protein
MLRNFTPHMLEFYTPQTTIPIQLKSEGVIRLKQISRYIKNERAFICSPFQRSRVKEREICRDSIRSNAHTIPIEINEITYNGLEGVPNDIEKDDTLIVSRPVAEFVRNRNYVCPDDMVRDSSGNIIGCRKLATFGEFGY